ncbi:MTP-1 family protein [Metabacillus sp. RGM 3146]|uniref:MTP-1 family protein n=1 Tax=Metabacillus sp. RGM 3146 TaxID=3401092 RepID=UPI003B9CC8D2
MAVLTKGKVKTCEQLLQAFTGKPVNPEKIVFYGIGERDVYNISAPFEDEGERVIAGRVESRDSEHSNVYFFVKRNGEWVPRENAPVLELQDPFFTRIGEELVLGGVQIFTHPTIEGALGWRTVFYKGKCISGLKEFAKGPDGMKDLRLVELNDGTIGVLTRPQGEKGGRGKIGWTRISSLGELNINVIDGAALLEGQFIDEEWGGANEPHLLANGLVGVLGHIANFDKEGNRHYYPMVFALNPEKGELSDIELIATRSHFLPGPFKRPDLADVVFSGGLVRKSDGTADMYAGISDAEAQKITIADPFLKFEH